MYARRRRWVRRIRWIAMAPILPAAFGGCPDDWNGIVDGIEGASNALVADITGSGPEVALQRGLISAFSVAVFERLRTDTP